MSNPNNMQAFITLNTEHGDVEMNPAFIIFMQRATHVTTGMPCTNIHLTTGATMCVFQTPEQIAQLQMDAAEKIMTAVVSMTQKIMEQIDDFGGL